MATMDAKTGGGMLATSKPNRAFMVRVPTLDPDLIIIIAGPNAGRVRYESLVSAWEVYRKDEVSFAHVRVNRAPEYDELAALAPLGVGDYDARRLGWKDNHTKHGCMIDRPCPYQEYEARKRLLVGLTPEEYQAACMRIARELGV